MDSVWDAQADPEIEALVAFYKTQLDRRMNKFVGVAHQTLRKGYPQSLLSNFTADAMLEMAEEVWGSVDFSIMNMGGLRASINEGDVNLGNLYEVYPFENRMVLIELPGHAVVDFFDFVAVHGGQGLSGTVALVVRAGAVESITIGGRPIDNNKVYRVATIDYLAEGNDGMVALKQATRMEDSGRQLREWMISYVEALTLNNKKIDAKVDGRIVVWN
jgi:2',3'-cyclic-nucleotide 2'-phosphodiesterase (5'-nucleotidase family)